VADPDHFDGCRDKFVTWFRQVRLYLRAKADAINTDEKKIIATLSRMRGGVAGPWADSFSDQALTTNDFGTWADFEAKVTATFEDKARKKNAREKLQTLKQGYKLIDDFFTEFDTVAQEADMTDDAERIFLLERNVREELIDQLYLQATLPETYDEWKDRLLAVGRMRERRNERKKGFAKSSPVVGTVASVPRRDTPRSPVVEQDVKTSSGVTFGGSGKPMDIDEARRKGLCFNCGGSGHISRNCMQKRKTWNARTVVEGLDEDQRKELREALTQNAPSQDFQSGQD